MRNGFLLSVTAFCACAGLAFAQAGADQSSGAADALDGAEPAPLVLPSDLVEDGGSAGPTPAAVGGWGKKSLFGSINSTEPPPRPIIISTVGAPAPAPVTVPQQPAPAANQTAAAPEAPAAAATESPVVAVAPAAGNETTAAAVPAAPAGVTSPALVPAGKDLALDLAPVPAPAAAATDAVADEAATTAATVSGAGGDQNPGWVPVGYWLKTGLRLPDQAPSPSPAPLPPGKPADAPPPAVVNAAPVPADPPPLVHDDPPSPWTHRTGGFAQLLYLSPRGVDVPYAVPITGFGPVPPPPPQGELAVVETHYRPSYRAGFEVALTCSSSIKGDFTEFTNNNTDHTVAPPGLVLESLLTHPNTASAMGAGLQATAAYGISYGRADLEFSHLLWSTDCWAVNGLVGGAYGRLDETLRVDYAVLGLTTVTTDLHFHGGGPRVGLDGEYLLGYGFSTYTEGLADFLAGSFTGEYRQNNLFVGNEADLLYRDKRIVPILELDAGVAWTSPGRHLRVMAGYLVTDWMNVVTVPGLVRAAQTNNFTRQGDNLSDSLLFDGLTSRVALQF